jgi:hypothetical protein
MALKLNNNILYKEVVYFFVLYYLYIKTYEKMKIIKFVNTPYNIFDTISRTFIGYYMKKGQLGNI